MSINSIVGHDRNITLLKQMIRKRRLPHALLFIGPEGIGKCTTAKEFAKLLLCEQLVHKNNDIESCEKCDSCRMINLAVHPDFEIISPQTKDGHISIDQIREVERKSYQSPVKSYYKIYIIDAAESLRTEAQNSLLKILEEPPKNVIFILIAKTEVHLLPTILSRCAKLRFSPLKPHALKSILLKNGVPEKDSTLLSQLNLGSPGYALKLYKENFTNEYDEYKKFILHLQEGQLDKIIEKFDSIEGDIKNEFKKFLLSLALIYYKEYNFKERLEPLRLLLTAANYIELNLNPSIVSTWLAIKLTSVYKNL